MSETSQKKQNEWESTLAGLLVEGSDTLQRLPLRYWHGLRRGRGNQSPVGGYWCDVAARLIRLTQSQFVG